MRVILSKLMPSAKVSALLLICLVIFKCQKTEYVTENEGDDPDEIGYIGEDLSGEDLTERASTFKISQVVTTDSLPEFQVANPAKKQKFGKRQIVHTTKKTRFTLRGIGFGVQSDSSNVKCYIKKAEQAGIEIVSWDSLQVVVDFPILTSQLLIDNTFSIQFKLFVKNKTVGKANVSRSRSRSCISDTKAATVISIKCKTSLDTVLGYRKYVMGLPDVEFYNGFPKAAESMFDVASPSATPPRLKYVARVGDVLFDEDNYEGEDYAGVITSIFGSDANIRVMRNQVCENNIITFDSNIKVLGCEFKTMPAPSSHLNIFVPYNNQAMPKRLKFRYFTR